MRCEWSIRSSDRYDLAVNTHTYIFGLGTSIDLCIHLKLPNVLVSASQAALASTPPLRPRSPASSIWTISLSLDRR